MAVISECVITKDAEDMSSSRSAAKEKRNKKKREKEKLKKAAAAASASEKPENDIKDEEKKKKKVSRAVREMQEALAARREAEERKKREEEEKQREEEEERMRQEELERQAEEARRRKKEKLLKKRQEGKLLTPKQKEEARRLASMRAQILSKASVACGPTKGPRPLYDQKKKSKQLAAEDDGIKGVESTITPDKLEITTDGELRPAKVADTEEAQEEDGAEEDGEWDSRSYYGLVTPLSVKPEQAVKKTQPAELISQRNYHKLPTSTVAIPAKEAAFGGENHLRSPICCIMGHVDAGKTKLLDRLRGTNVQDGEAGGITQQIGATYFPADNIRQLLKDDIAKRIKLPGLLVIDTPGHESFSNLRSRGSGLCDIAILVVDIMDGLKPQTIESLDLLRMGNTDFIIALNKVDRLYGWKTFQNTSMYEAIKQQSKDVQSEFKMRVEQIITQFKEQGLNTRLCYRKGEIGTLSIVPTSAMTGEGIRDLLCLLVQRTQTTMVDKLTFCDKVQCTVMEVKVVEGHGTTIDVVLANGVLHEGDQIVVCGSQGPIVTTIRALLTTPPMKELRVKGEYLHHKEIRAAQGIKITGQGLESARAGTGLYVVGLDDNLEDVKKTAMGDMESVLSRSIEEKSSGEGVFVQASTHGSLEALLEFFKSPAVGVPVGGTSIGTVHRKDVRRASRMLDKKKKEYAIILAFDVRVSHEARELADKLGIKIFTADIIYHLFDQFKAYMVRVKEEEKREAEDETVFPCVLKILPGKVFYQKNPIVLGVQVLEGIAKAGTPVCVKRKEFICIGRIRSLQNNGNPVTIARKGQTVSIQIGSSDPGEQPKVFGRHFDQEDELVSRISRRSIDILKSNYRGDLSSEDWKLVAKLKKIFNIQ